MFIVVILPLLKYSAVSILLINKKLNIFLTKF